MGDFRGYRAKTKDGKWIYGSLVFDGVFYSIYRNIHTIYDVISSTVGQWTGCYDKNGTKVYEGDIIRDGNRLFVVVFEAPQFCAKEIDKNIFYLLSLKEDMEVVGNIYDDVWMMDLN